MVKGISKQVILVRPQEEDLFEQAIFIVRDGVSGITEKELLRQAGAAADVDRKRQRIDLTTLLGFLGGGSVVGLIWFICWIL